MTTAGPYPPSWPPVEPANIGDWTWSVIANAWEWVGDQQATLVALAAIVASIAAIFALTSTASDSRERSRPIVLAFFRLAPHNESAFDLVVHNYGLSGASEVEVTFDPPFGEDERKDHMMRALAERYGKRVPLMPPGSEITNVWWALDFTAPDGSGKNRYPAPDEAVITISYRGARRRRYKEKIKLDTNWMKGDTSTVSSGSRPGLQKQNAASMKRIAEEARAARILLRDIAAALPDPAQPSEHLPEQLLPEIVHASGSDLTALASRLGVSEQKAIEIIAILEREPTIDDVDVVSNGQILPGSANMS